MGAVEAELVPAVVAGGVGQIGADVLDGGALAGLGSAGQVAGFGGGVGSRLAVVADLDDCDVADRLAGGRTEDLDRLLLSHGPGWSSGLALGQIHEVGHVPAD